MLARVYSCAVIGLEGVIVEVEVDTGPGLPMMVIVGLPDTAVQESRERVQSAVKNAGLPYPRKRVTVNLAPASVRKEGPAYDLPIALGVLIASELIPPESLESALVIGELSLDGSVRHVRGVLPMAALARQQGFKRVFVPKIDSAEAALIPDLQVVPVESLSHLVAYLTGQEPVCLVPPVKVDEGDITVLTDFREIKGQEHVKRALEVAAAGGHNVLLFDQRNPTFFCEGSSNERGLMPFLKSFLPEEISGRIHSISIQQVIATYQENGGFSWLNEFMQKYGLI